MIIPHKDGIGKFYSATERGWVRRSDLGPNAWEKPTGEIYTHYDGSEPVVAVFNPRSTRE
jgi:hypothetical protein